MDEVTFRGTALIDDILNARFRILAITPFERSDHRLASALLRQDIAVAIDAGRNPPGWDEFALPRQAACPGRLGVRIADQVVPSFGRLPDEIGFLVVAGDLARLPPECWRVPVIAQVCSVAQAARAIDAGASGLIAKGQESGGLSGDESSFVLLQRVGLRGRRVRRGDRRYPGGLSAKFFAG
jgi:hypothetical protein